MRLEIFSLLVNDVSRWVSETKKANVEDL